jgi:AraC family transcriptional regulator
MSRAGRETELQSQHIADVIAAASSDSRATDRAPTWLERVRESIDDWNGWPAVSALATEAGVHRVHLARQFRRYYGTSVSDYIRHRRVQQAAHRLSVAKRTISEVAHMSGFYDHAHMCRAFRELSTLSPTAFRAFSNPLSNNGGQLD